jgi:polysaccharide biosynthesis/export protein
MTRKAALLQAWSVALLMLTGCTTASGTRFTLFPEGHPLLESTKALRQRESLLPLPRELDKHSLPPYTVEPGDVLLVMSPEHEPPAEEAAIPPEKNPPPPIRIPSDQPVLPDGSINLGRYGRLIVSGKTMEEIEGMIRTTVHAQIKRDPGFISVRIITRESKVYYVLGEVNTPGSFTLKGRETVLDAILAAGGLNERASRENITLTRPTPPNSCRIVLPICWHNITQQGDTTTNYQIMPGDRILVPSRSACEGGGIFASHKKCDICKGCQNPCPTPVHP